MSNQNNKEDVHVSIPMKWFIVVLCCVIGGPTATTRLVAFVMHEAPVEQKGVTKEVGQL